MLKRKGKNLFKSNTLNFFSFNDSDNIVRSPMVEFSHILAITNSFSSPAFIIFWFRYYWCW